ncbi:MAG TPA: hypothetical protein VGN81_39010 [Pseudonocardiaceae bacterium]|jgi:hypothetical protein
MTEDPARRTPTARRFRSFLVGLPLLVLTIALTACGASTTRVAEPVTTDPIVVPTTTITTSAEAPPVTPTEAPTTTTPSFNLPPGYPKVVTVASLPSQVRNWYRMSGDTQAVALAPGVWIPLPDGASVEDAVNSDVADGFCASIKAYARTYLGGEQPDGACW